MELIFAYVGYFKNIQNQAFNLSTRYNVNCDRELEQLTITQNTEHIEGFFGEGISNVTAIVGKNGTGKSNLMEFLILHTAGLQGSWFSPTILISQYESEKISIVTNISGLSVITEVPYELKKSDQNNPSFTAECYYYSYLFDGDLKLFQKSPNLEQRTITDLSTNIRVKFQEQFRIRGVPSEMLEKISYAALETRSIAKIIWQLGPSKTFGFNLPDFLRINADVELAKNNLLSYLFGDGKIDEEIRSKIDFISQHLDSNTPYDKFRCALFFTILTSRSVGFDIINAIHFIKHLVEKLNANQVLDDQTLFQPIYNSSAHEGPVRFLRFLSNISKFRLPLDAYFIPLSERKIIEQFFEHLEDLNLRIREAFHYTFTFGNVVSTATFSGGEKALLTLLGRFTNVDPYGGRGKVIFLDEADLGFHPEWQKKWFKYIVEYLPKLVAPYKPIHLVIAAHSPFILSDIPRENVLFLEKTPEGKCAISPGTQHEKTFGANIHTLLSDAFFMSEGLLGDFAVQKIEEVIKEIKQRDLSVEKRDRIRKIIDMVGEPIIRSKLEEMYDLYQR